MVAYILPCYPVAKNKTYSNKNKKHNVYDSGIVSIVGGRHRSTKLDLRFYNHKECKTFSDYDNNVLCQRRLSYPTEFGQSKNRTLKSSEQGKGDQCKRQKKHDVND